MVSSFAFVVFIHTIVLVFGHENSTVNALRSNSSELQDPEQLEESANVMFDEYWQIILQDNPEYATVLGDHRYDDRLDTYSLKCYEKKKVMMNEFLERANQLLSISTEGSQIHSDLLLFIINLQSKLDRLMSGSHLFPVSQLTTPVMDLHSILKYTKVNSAEQAWNLIARYKAVPKQVDEKIELMREGIRTNFTLSEISIFSKSEEVNAIQENASDAILNYVMPAFIKIDDFMNNEYRAHARPEIGVSSLPNGRDFYQHELSYHLSDSSVTAEQIHRMGLQEVERISKEMDEVIKSLNLSMTHQEFSNMIRNDESQFFKTEEEALETYREVLEKDIAPKLHLLFKKIPEKKLIVEKMPKEMATGPQAYYMMPSADNSTPGTFIWIHHLFIICK
ncbi:uncharacterized protein TNIN_223681 [Trichonephila inaurata madagascariensis]|uniref:DUF885 domain-containing protein n=1 Tax=Trichonephila inaurata madagascariensis TaxID=2747483 RepID=A0A8X6X869_9ARAC|nr:uncharacterized protein TNIN_223681 [Trichonephila inaurata madagascariensis]